MKLRHLLITVHTRDSGKPALVNPYQIGCAKEQDKCRPQDIPERGLDGRGGTAIWVLGRQEPFYIRETIDELGDKDVAVQGVFP